MRQFIQAGVGSLAIAGSFIVATPAMAVTEHCDSSAYPNKVETSGDSATVHTALDPYTKVCVKAGTRIVLTTTDGYGNITNTTITNVHGKPLGISYYAWDDNPYPPS